MSLAHSPKIVTDGLILYTDMNNSEKSFRGAPTTNIHDNSMNIYNNVPDHVTAALVSTSETYRGAVVWRLTLTPTTATGVGYLTAGNNPGIGVYTNGGGGLANRYTGHAIFYKTTVPMHSTPLFTNYSNIAGWGAGPLGSNRSVPMGDGWARGEVIWYDTVTRSDGKFWAINPATATINVPIVILWAGPFKEDRNDSGHVAAYTTGTRSSTQSLLDLTSRNTITSTNLTYASNGSFSFNGSSSEVSASANASSLGISNDLTISIFTRRAASPTNELQGQAGFGTGGSISFKNTNHYFADVFSTTPTRYTVRTAPGDTIASYANVWVNLCVTVSGTTVKTYFNGDLLTTQVMDSTIKNFASEVFGIAAGYGYYRAQGDVPTASVYNRALTDAEVRQNFNALRGRYGI